MFIETWLVLTTMYKFKVMETHFIKKYKILKRLDM